MLDEGDSAAALSSGAWCLVGLVIFWACGFFPLAGVGLLGLLGGDFIFRVFLLH